MTKLTNNRTFNIMVGAGTLYFAFSLWRDGWFDWFLNGQDDSEGYSSSQLWITLGSLVLSFLEMVGIATIAIVTGVLPHVETMFTWAAKQLKTLIKTARDSISKKDASLPDGETWDWRPLAAIILSWMLWSGGQLESLWNVVINAIPDRVDVVSHRPAAILFSVDPAMATEGQLAVASSVAVEEMMQAKGIERRMYSSMQDRENAEGWVGQAMQAAPDGENSLIIYNQNGALQVLKIPSTIPEMEAIADGW